MSRLGLNWMLVGAVWAAVLPMMEVLAADEAGSPGAGGPATVVRFTEQGADLVRAEQAHALELRRLQREAEKAEVEKRIAEARAAAAKALSGAGAEAAPGVLGSHSYVLPNSVLPVVPTLPAPAAVAPPVAGGQSQSKAGEPAKGSDKPDSDKGEVQKPLPKLTAIRQGRAWFVADGQVVSAGRGDRVGEYMLERLGVDHVVLQRSDGARIELRLVW